jgi:hypothetical protein
MGASQQCRPLHDRSGSRLEASRRAWRVTARLASSSISLLAIVDDPTGDVGIEATDYVGMMAGVSAARGPTPPRKRRYWACREESSENLPRHHGSVSGRAMIARRIALSTTHARKAGAFSVEFRPVFPAKCFVRALLESPMLRDQDREDHRWSHRPSLNILFQRVFWSPLTAPCCCGRFSHDSHLQAYSLYVLQVGRFRSYEVTGPHSPASEGE